MVSTRILIVDDDRDFAKSFADVLKIHGHRVDLASSGAEAVQKCQQKCFDITFMDVNMPPGLDGVESFLQIRSFRPDARVVIMTAYALPELLQKAKDNGVWQIIHKPLDIEHVLELVQQARPGAVALVVDDKD